MPTLLALAAGGLAFVALAAAFYQVAHKLGQLESAAREVPDQPASAPAPRASGGRPMLSALYQQPEPSPLEAVNRLPGGRWLVAASVLAIASLLIASTAGRGSSEPRRTVPDSTVAALTRRVDSLAAGIVVLRDSLRVLTVERPGTQGEVPPPAAKLARRSATKANAVVPAAPVSPFSASP